MKNTKGFILGFLSCMLIFTLVLTVFAAPIEKTVTAIYNDIKIKINGEEFIPKNENGKTVEPFQVDGTTYLPVRAISEALGMDVEWDQATHTVLLSGIPKLNGSQINSKVFHINEPDDSTYDFSSAHDMADFVSPLTVIFNPTDPEAKAAATKFVMTDKFSKVYFETVEEVSKELHFTPKGLSYIPEGYSFYDVRVLKDEKGNYENTCWIRYISDERKKVDKTTAADISLHATYVGENATVHVTTNQYFEQITLNGNVEALLIITEFESGDQKSYDHEIIWIKDGVAYSLSSAFFDRAEMIKMAESVD